VIRVTFTWHSHLYNWPSRSFVT